MPVTALRSQMLSGQLGFGCHVTQRHSTVKGLRLLSFLCAGF